MPALLSPPNRIGPRAFRSESAKDSAQSGCGNLVAATLGASPGSARARRPGLVESSLVFFVVGGNLRKGAVLKRSRSRSCDWSAEW